jgi:CBS domain-containing protein
MAISVGAIMTRSVIAVPPDASVSEIARTLSANAISAVPVCGLDKQLLGIVSEGDLLRPFGQTHHLRRDWWLALLAEGNDLAPDFMNYIRQDNRTAADLMTKSLHTANVTTSLEEAAELMTRYNIKRLPVLQDGKLVGVVSRADVVRALMGPKPNLGATAVA